MTPRLDQLVRVEVAPDKLEAALVLQPGISPQDLSPIALHALLDQAGLPKAPQRDAGVRAAILQYQESGGAQTRVRVASGKPPLHAQDARLEMSPALLPQDERKSDSADTTSRTDHYSRSSLRSVRAGDLVATIIPATTSVDGVDVFGAVIPATPGKQLALAFDDTLEVRKTGEVIALVSGAPVRSRDRLGITTKLVLTDVDFGSGNVDFPGDVVIERAVKDCFSVRAGGDIEVKQLVDAANLSADGSIRLTLGMAARDKGTLSAGKDIAARYLSNVSVRAGRSLSIETELSGCNVVVAGGLDAPRCTLLRSDVAVARAASVGEVGSATGAPCTLRLGHVEGVPELLARLSPMHASLRKQAARTRAEILALSEGKPNPEKLTQLTFDASRLEQQLTRLRTAAASLRTFVEGRSEVLLRVSGTVHPGSLLHVSNLVFTLTQPLVGPLVITLGEGDIPSVRETGSGKTRPLSEFSRVTQAFPDSLAEMTGEGRARAAA